MMEAVALQYSLETPMPYGKYKFTKIVEVPYDYLQRFSTSMKDCELKRFLVENIKRIEEIQIAKLFPKGNNFCDKALFATKKIANARIREIQGTHSKTGLKPIRSYYCDTCGGWHLTKQEKNESKTYR